MKLWARLAFLLLELVCLALPCCAEQQQECWDVECANSPDKGWHVDSLEIKLPECGVSDQTICRSDCRREFGKAFKDCLSSCLSQRCVNPLPKDKVSVEQGALCLEIETRQCDQSCKTKPEAARAPCRRDCLAKRCPAASSVDIAKEALSPGSSACERCKLQAKELCSVQCGVNLSGRRESESGLINFGCEKACTLAACVKDCDKK